MYIIISSANNETLTSFLNCIPLISFWCLIALGRTWRTILNRYGESGQLCLVPDFSRIANSFFPFSLMLVVGLVYIALIMFRYSYYYCILQELHHEGMLYFLKSFFASNEMIMWFLFFNLFIWWITLADFHMLNHPCICGMKLTWSWWMMVLMCSWIWFASIII